MDDFVEPRKTNEDVLDEDNDTTLNPPLIDSNISASLARLDIFRPRSDEMPEFNPYEANLNALYRVGD
jgi:hypothetical protein